jgi:hypothetical protein
MPSRHVLEAQAFAAEARCRLTEWEIEDWLREVAAGRSSRGASGSARPVDQDLLDRKFAEFMLSNRRAYPAYVNTPLDSLIRGVRAQRLEAEAERGAARYAEAPPTPNYSLFR